MLNTTTPTAAKALPMPVTAGTGTPHANIQAPAKAVEIDASGDVTAKTFDVENVDHVADVMDKARKVSKALASADRSLHAAEEHRALFLAAYKAGGGSRDVAPTDNGCPIAYRLIEALVSERIVKGAADNDNNIRQMRLSTRAWLYTAKWNPKALKEQRDAEERDRKVAELEAAKAAGDADTVNKLTAELAPPAPGLSKHQRLHEACVNWSNDQLSAWVAKHGAHLSTEARTDLQVLVKGFNEILA